MARTTSTLVSGILEETPTISLTSFIETANKMVTKHCSSVSDYDSDDLELIERYLAAHFYHITVEQANAEHAGPVGQTKRSKIDVGLSLTHFGQQAMLLDWAGGLANLNERIKNGVSTTAIGIHWLGNEKNELTDDDE